MKHKAITLLELIIVVSIFMLLVLAAMPRMMSGLYANQIEVTGQELVHVIREAQSNAMDSYYGTAWGVHFETTEYVLFSGNDFRTRDTSLDRSYNLPGSVTFGTIDLNGSGMVSDVIFDKASGITGNDGTVDLDYISDPSQTITITRFGHVQKN